MSVVCYNFITLSADSSPVVFIVAHGSRRGGRAEDDGKRGGEKKSSSTFVFSLPISPCALFLPPLPALYLLFNNDWGRVRLVG